MKLPLNENKLAGFIIDGIETKKFIFLYYNIILHSFIYVESYLCNFNDQPD